MTRKLTLGLGAAETKGDATTRVAREIVERNAEQVAARIKRQREARIALEADAPPAKKPRATRSLKAKPPARAKRSTS